MSQGMETFDAISALFSLRGKLPVVMSHKEWEEKERERAKQRAEEYAKMPKMRPTGLVWGERPIYQSVEHPDQMFQKGFVQKDLKPERGDVMGISTKDGYPMPFLRWPEAEWHLRGIVSTMGEPSGQRQAEEAGVL